MSLIEVMVAVLIGMIGILIITHAYITGENFQRSTLGESGAQTNGLVALYTVERDARMSGYGMNNSGALGCGQIYWYYDPSYSSNISGGSLPNLTLAPVVITVDATPSVPDMITIMYSREAERMMPTTINGFNASSSEVSVDGTDGFKAGDLIILVGSTGCTLGKITHVQPGPQKLQLNPGLSAPHNPPAWGSFPTTYNSGDAMVNLGDPVVRTYLIGNNGKLRVADTYFSAGLFAPVDLVDGIVDLRAQYGKDNGVDNGTVTQAVYAANDGIVDSYDNVTPNTGSAWLQVLSLRLGILARIGTYEKPDSAGVCDATTEQPRWTGGTFQSVGDVTVNTNEARCYRYRVFETTIPLRNMIWRAS